MDRWLPSWPESDTTSLLAVANVLNGQRWAVASSLNGAASAIDQVERRLSGYFGRNYAITTCNGSAAIVIALRALGIGRGSRVLVPGLTWVACATAVLRAGATPVFADCQSNSPLVDLHAATKLGKIDAILAVHLYASRLPLPVVERLFPGVPVVEDFSHVHGASEAGRGGRISICSFQASKLLTCGEGGAAFTDDPALARKLEALRTDTRMRPTGSLEALAVDLIPSSDIQGANYALSEPTAGLLYDQLNRLREQQSRRARGASVFKEAALRLGLTLEADEDLLLGGSFYRLPVLASSGEAAPELLERARQAVFETAGFKVDRSYPSVPTGPLFRPMIAQFSRQMEDEPILPNAEAWAGRMLPLQHEFFLAAPSIIDEVAKTIASVLSSTSSFSRQPKTRLREAITVIIVTQGLRSSIRTAIDSIFAQDYAGVVKLLIVSDGNYRKSTDSMRGHSSRQVRHVQVEINFEEDASSKLLRVSRLRNIAISLVDTPLVAFLDDDNHWTASHLSSLEESIFDRRSLAAHSWRRIVTPTGEPWDGSDFPWLPPGPKRVQAWRKMVEASVIREGEDVIRDRARIDGFVGMVDLGEWLFRVQLLRLMPFSQSYTQDDVADMIGEDDKLLRSLVSAGMDPPCTELATLIYRLGGFSNSDFSPEGGR